MILYNHFKRLYLTVFFASLALAAAYAQALPENEMRAHYINVGQANATLLEFSCGAILIDAGAQDDATDLALIKYLKRFFTRRTDLNNTLNLVVITHCHKDHNEGLKNVVSTFKVLNYIDNGARTGSGRTNQKWLEDNATSLGIKYAGYTFEQALSAPGHNGLSNEIIDPLQCSGTDPKISILSGRFAQLPSGWTQHESDKNGNLHSLVVKVEFGQSSFLFTGDLEIKAIRKVLSLYANTNKLTADVWEVSHHGAENGTTPELLRAITPKYAVISCAKWDDGINTPAGSFNTYNYGHPRISTLDALAEKISGNRPPLDSVVAFNGIREKHKKVKIVKNIYSTAWDGIIVIAATNTGSYHFLTL
jgi:competence protein ComEC